MQTSILRAITSAFSFALATMCVSAADAPAGFKAGAFTFSRPSTWQWVPATSPMRKAELKVPGKDPAQAAEVIFFHFGAGQGGGVQANVERWYGQFAEGRDKINARSEDKKLTGLEITYVFAEGTYLSGPPMGAKVPMKDYALVGAIIEDSAGSVFIKMTGPKDLTKTAEADFRKMVEGAKR